MIIFLLADISEHLSKNAFVAQVDIDSNPSQPWDMHKPLSNSCRLQFLKTTDKNPWIPNNTFWRSCSFMLGAVVSKAFRDDIAVILHSFPSPNGLCHFGPFPMWLTLSYWMITIWLLFSFQWQLYTRCIYWARFLESFTRRDAVIFSRHGKVIRARTALWISLCKQRDRRGHVFW